VNNPRSLQIFIGVLVLALCISLAFLARALLQNLEGRLEVQILAVVEGATRARHDFQSGRLRLFVISGERSEDKPSGTNDGPFEVWFPYYIVGNPEVPAFRYAEETKVRAYNDMMRYMHEHPAPHPTSTNATEQTKP
jgi:hypothetical protein